MIPLADETTLVLPPVVAVFPLPVPALPPFISPEAAAGEEAYPLITIGTVDELRVDEFELDPVELDDEELDELDDEELDELELLLEVVVPPPLWEEDVVVVVDDELVVVVVLVLELLLEESLDDEVPGSGDELLCLKTTSSLIWFISTVWAPGG